ncbi:MAG: hypothetical protein NTY17_00245, partial [Planctomycetia bacterium]|nr:hypothetical protein [Planctomycetia bacterium]
VPAGRGIPLLADIPDGERRDGRPQRVIRREDAVGRLRMQMRVVIECRSERVQNGDGTEL